MIVLLVGQGKTVTSVAKLNGGRTALLHEHQEAVLSKLCYCLPEDTGCCGKVTPTTITRVFTKADIVAGLTSDSIESTKTDDCDGEDTGDTGLGLLDAPIAQLLISDTEDEEFEGFMEDKAADEVVDE
ncbi:hypothetical protein TURU_015423 [Turdus rufiventris]|nr:hypothetical protein TURU_015423 [Turdus rufiventris]